MALPLPFDSPWELAMPDAPWPAPPPCPRWANAGRLNASEKAVKAVIRMKCFCFTNSSCVCDDRDRAGGEPESCLGTSYCKRRMPPFREWMQGVCSDSLGTIALSVRSHEKHP